MAFAAFLTALLAGMGVGSGGLFVVFLTVFLDYPQLAAQGLNLYFFIFATAAALLLHVRAQRLHFSRLALVCGVGAVGCVGGAMLAQALETGLLRSIFAVVLIASGVFSLFRDRKKQPAGAAK
mgnify:CR=1 FL=1